MRTARVIAACVVVATVAGVPAAAAKDFRPGSLRLCGATRCVPIMNQRALNTLSAFYYGSSPPAIASQPGLGVPYLELRFANGYVTGIVALAKLDRFLSFGVYRERFQRGSWYAVPQSAAHELRRLAGSSVTPFKLTREALARSR